MITNKQELKFYISEDKKRYKLRITDKFLYNENYYIFKYLKNLRKLEYYSNIRKNPFQKLIYAFYYWNYKRLSFKHLIKIGINTCGPGLYIPHRGLIRIGTFAKVGSNCTIGPNVVIGTKNKFQNIATIGNNVEICLGVKIIGKLNIGDNAIIAPNSVVIKDVEANTIVSGIPAKVINKVNILSNTV